MITVICLPVIGLAAVGGVQIAYVESIKAKTQDIADNAALMGAQQLGVSQSGAQSRAIAWANAELAKLPSATSYNVTSSLVNGGDEVQINIDTQTASFFGPELPVGGFPTHVTATAQSLSQSPLCALVFGTSGPNFDLNLDGAATLSSTCLVYSDHNILGGGALTAPGNAPPEVVGTANGPHVTPAALTGASPVADPFGSMNLSFASDCPSPPGPPVNYSSNATITPPAANQPSAGAGQTPYLLCGGVTLKPNVTLTLGPGLYYINGPVNLSPNSTLSGANVTLVFGPGGTITAGPGTSVSLGGAQSGPYAGFVIATTRDWTGPQTFTIPSDPFATVTGTIYSPVAELTINGSQRAAHLSDWTVIVAKGVHLTGSPTIVLNSNYATSSVPTPSGVGERQGNAGSKLVD